MGNRKNFTHQVKVGEVKNQTYGGIMIHDNLDKFKVKKSKNLSVTSHAGLSVIGSFMKSLGIFKVIEVGLGHLKRRMRGYRVYEKIFYLMGMIISGGDRLRHIRIIESDSGLLRLFDRKDIPRPNTMGEFLRQFKRRDINVIRGISNGLVKKAIKRKRLRHITIDIDSTVIESEKESAEYRYKKVKGFNPLLGIIKELDMVISGVFRPGNASPSANNLSLLRGIYNKVKGLGVRRIYFRSDSAAYQYRIMRFCDLRGILFGIGADMDKAVRRGIRWIPSDRWEYFSEGEEIAETQHFIGPDQKGDAYRLIVKRRKVRDPVLFEEFKYSYYAIITNIYNWDKSAVMRWYQRRGDAENTIKELKGDYALNSIPTGELLANSAFFQIILLAFNLMRLFALTVLPYRWSIYRLKTLRFTLINIGGSVIKHGREIILNLPNNYPYYELFQRTRWRALNAYVYV